MNKTTLRNIALTTILWVIIIISFQWIVSTRLDLQRPDLAVSWSKTETGRNSNYGKIYLTEPFMNRQVAWDSEYYVGIAVGGYDDPQAGTALNPATGKDVIRNYSFFPLYSYVMRVVAYPLGWFGLNPIAAASLAGVLIAILGTLCGLIALYDLTQPYFDNDSSMRAVFYALIFPTAFFFAMVYTEGLFIGLAFGALALAKRGQWVWASLLGLLAAWTRAHGAALALPLLVLWLMQIDWRGTSLKTQLTWKWFLRGALALLPLAGYLIWRTSPLGQGWAQLQEFYFGRGLLTFGKSIDDWLRAIDYGLHQGGGAGLIYIALEIGSVILAFIASLWLIRRDPAVALFSLAVVTLSVFSGSAQSMARYMLIVPAVYIFLAQLGKNKTFDRSWTIFSPLLLGMEATLFAFDFWVG